MATTSPIPLFEYKPAFVFNNPHEGWVNDLVELNDGSFISCADDVVANRWSISPNDHNSDSGLQLVASYDADTFLNCALQMDDETLLTGDDEGLKEWNLSTLECLNSVSTEYSTSLWILLLTTKHCDPERVLVCGYSNGTVEMRRSNEITSIIALFTIHTGSYCGIRCICELSDGTFVSASQDQTLKRWNSDGRVIRTIFGHRSEVERVIELRVNILVSASSDYTVKIWKLPFGECLRNLTLHTLSVNGLMRVSESKFASISDDKTLRVWNIKGECVETIHTEHQMTACLRLSHGSIVTAKKERLEIRRRYIVALVILSSLTQSSSSSRDSYQVSLVELCCTAVYKNQSLFNVDEIKLVLPEEFIHLCFDF